MFVRSLLERVLSWLSRHETPATLRAANDGASRRVAPGTWCLVGNVVAAHSFGEDSEVRRGSKHFTPGTKVYCLPPQWGDGYEKVVAIGIARGSRRWVTVVMPSRLITNWRAKRVFEPPVLKRLGRGFDGFAGQWASQSQVEDFARAMLAQRSAP